MLGFRPAVKICDVSEPLLTAKANLAVNRKSGFEGIRFTSRIATSTVASVDLLSNLKLMMFVYVVTTFAAETLRQRRSLKVGDNNLLSG